MAATCRAPPPYAQAELHRTCRGDSGPAATPIAQSDRAPGSRTTPPDGDVFAVNWLQASVIQYGHLRLGEHSEDDAASSSGRRRSNATTFELPFQRTNPCILRTRSHH